MRQIVEPTHLSADRSVGHDQGRADQLGGNGVLSIELEAQPPDTALGPIVEIETVWAEREQRRRSPLMQCRLVPVLPFQADARYLPGAFTALQYPIDHGVAQHGCAHLVLGLADPPHLAS